MEALEGVQSNIELGEQTVGAVVAANYRAAEVFTKYGIDYCCGGDKPLDQACAEKGISPSDLLNEVALAAANGETIHEYNQWPLGFLAEYIVNQHHAYAKKRIPEMKAMTEAVVAVHGEEHPEVHTIEKIWQELSGELVMHMQKEELMLFPHIKRIVRSKEEGTPLSPPRFGSVATLVQTMEDEHESTGDQLAELEQLTNGFTPPADACYTFQTLYAYLDEFQKETKEHVHLENNILFPKAIALEKEMS
ncbi:MAG: iron-sulfur cluster repair di-iron protein [Caldilineaceae bacterium]|nr:iron-sulfur cluster repair di-iron protein [Caldilineaceae bacterium]